MHINTINALKRRYSLEQFARVIASNIGGELAILAIDKNGYTTLSLQKNISTGGGARLSSTDDIDAAIADCLSNGLMAKNYTDIV